MIFGAQLAISNYRSGWENFVDIAVAGVYSKKNKANYLNLKIG